MAPAGDNQLAGPAAISARPGFIEGQQYLLRTHNCGPVSGRATGAVGFFRIGTGCQKQCDNLMEAKTRGTDQRHFIVLCNTIGVGTAGQQNIDNFNMAAPRRQRQGGGAIGVTTVGLGTKFKQRPHHMGMPPIGGGVQGRAVIKAAFINIGPGEKLKPDALKITHACLVDKGFVFDHRFFLRRNRHACQGEAKNETGNKTPKHTRCARGPV